MIHAYPVGMESWVQATVLFIPVGCQHYCFCSHRGVLSDVSYRYGYSVFPHSKIYLVWLCYICLLKFITLLLYWKFALRYLGDENGLLSVLKYEVDDGKLQRMPYNVPIQSLAGTRVFLTRCELQRMFLSSNCLYWCTKSPFHVCCMTWWTNSNSEQRWL